MGEASWRRHHGGGITEEGGIMEDASRMHLGGIWEASGRHLVSIWMHLGSIWEAPGGIREASGGSRPIWGVLGGLGSETLTTLSQFAFFHKKY